MWLASITVGPTGGWLYKDNQCGYQVKNCTEMAQVPPVPAKQAQPAAVPVAPQGTGTAEQPETTGQSGSDCVWNAQKYHYDCW